jgi:4-amino-4-deoxy-L-arabinose transferase-like glycosyltransferase
VIESTKRRGSGAAWALAAILAAGLILRLWGIRSGLPVALNLDEYAHFTVTAVNMFGDGLNPHYFQNPPGFTYLLHGLFSIAYLEPPIHSVGKGIHHAFNTDATTIYTIARVTSAVMGIGASLALYFAGRRLWGTGVALAAAAFLTFTFLPVHYSHFALNDVPTLLPLCIGLFGLSGVVLNGRAVDYGVAGLGLGLATGTKYTAAALSVAIFVAWATHLYDDRERGKQEFKYLVLAAGVALLAFVIINPFAVIDHSKFFYDVRRQSDQSSKIAKLGTDDTNGWFYYAWTLFWGFGVLPLLLAIGGAAAALKSDWRKSLPFVVFGLIVFLFMGKQLRFYARWMMPIYPVLAVFAAYGAAELGKWISARLGHRAGERSPALAITAVMLIALVGPVIHVLHNDRVLSRTDTRQLAKQWVIENVPKDQKVAFDLLGPPPFYNVNGALKGDPAFAFRPLPHGSEVEKFAQNLSPAVLDSFEAEGYCYVVSGSTQKGRVTKDPSKAPGAAAYYNALDQRGEKVASFSPMRAGYALPKFNFDISYNYYPLGFYRPGPQIDIFRLSRGKCAAKTKN